MEANINCDMGETSKFSSAENDPDLLEIINTANIACGYHAGDEETMRKTIVLAKKMVLVLVLILPSMTQIISADQELYLERKKYINLSWIR